MILVRLKIKGMGKIVKGKEGRRELRRSGSWEEREEKKTIGFIS